MTKNSTITEVMYRRHVDNTLNYFINGILAKGNLTEN